MKIHDKPKVLEYDETEGIVDVFVQEDPDCPYPFQQDGKYHQGFYLSEFINMINRFFERNELPYKVSAFKTTIQDGDESG